MIDLSRHIEILLLENDCVILPGFGGFVTHYTSARWCQEEKKFISPCRSVGFNPQLKMNDGILVQSYMKIYDVDFSSASRLVTQDIELFIQELHKTGKIELANIGELKCSIQGSYIFNPYNSKIVSPILYGFDSFGMSELKDLRRPTVKTPAVLSPTLSDSKKHYEIKINRNWLHNTAAAIIVFVLFFSFSTPIENTDVERINYAQLMPADLFGRIEQYSLLTTLVEKEEEHNNTSEINNATDVEQTKQPKVVREIKVKAPPYYIIVASVTKEKDGEEMVQKLKKEGYFEAKLLTTDGKIRVSLKSCHSRDEANSEIEIVRKDKQFKNAWLLSNRK